MPQFISEEEFEALRHDPEALAGRADEVVASLQYDAERLRAKAESEAIVKEQTCAQLEQRYLALAEEYGQLETEERRLQSALAETGAELAEAQAGNHQEQLAKVGAASEAERLRSEVAELQAGRRTLWSSLEQKDLELQEKDASIRAYLDKIVALTDGRAAAEGKARAAEEDRQRLQAANARLMQEKEIAAGHLAWLTGELEASTMSLTRERHRAVEREAELCSQLALAEKSASDMGAATARAQERAATLEAALEQAQGRHRDAADAASERERRFAEELQTAHRLVQLHKESRAVVEAKFTELKGVAEGLRRAMSEEKEAYEARLTQETAVREASAAAAQAALDTLKKELEQAQEALRQEPLQGSLTVAANRQTGDGVLRLALSLRDEQAEGPRQLLQLSPLALGATLIKDGATLTEMYAQYQEAADAFRHERQERARVEREYNLLVTEINERLPALATEQAMFRSLESAYQSLLEKHADAGMRERDLRSQLTSLQAQLSRSGREKQGLERQVVDLQREVAIRLRPMATSSPSVLVTERGFGEVAAPRTPPQDGEWEFEDLQELVTKYGQATLRLQQVLEEREIEKQEVEERAKAEVSAAYERASQQVEEIRHHLEVRDAAMEQVKKQAAAFERLWRGASERSVGGTGAEGADCLAVAEKAHKDLQEAQVAAEKEKNELLQKMDEARRVVLGAEQAQRKAESALEFERERYRLLEGHFQSQAAELDGLRQRNLDFGASITQFQTQLRNAEQAAQDARDMERRLDTQVAILEKEKSLLAAAEARASKDASEASQKKHLAEALLEGTRGRLESQADVASAERQRLLEEVARLQHEWRDACEELEGERQRSRALIHARDQAAQDATQRIQAAESAATVAKNEAAEAGAREAAARTQMAALEEELRKTDAKLRATIRGDASAVASEEDREALTLVELEKVRATLRDVREDLAAAQRHFEQYKAIAAANESMLQQAAHEHDRFRAAAEATQAATEAEAETLRVRVSSLESEVGALQGVAEGRRREADASVEQGVRERQTLADEVAQMRGALQESEARVGALKEDLERLRTEYTHARAHYEQQVLVQAEAIRAQNAASAKLQAAEVAAQAAVSRAEAAEQLKASSEAAWASEKAALTAQEAHAERRAVQLAEQNRILLDRLEAQPSSVPSPPRLGTGAATGQGEEDLQNVLRYLRREKETAETALALARQEIARWRSQAEQANRAAEEARAELTEEAARAHRGLQHEEEHRALLAQVAQLNLLRESNSALREEAASNLREVARWRDQAREVEASVGTLKSDVREKEVAAEGATRERELAQQEAQRWKARAEQLTRKFEAVDLEEHRRVVEEVVRLEGQLREANETAAASAARLDEMKKETESLNRKFKYTLKKKDEEIKESKEARTSLETQVADQEARLKAVEAAPGLSRWQKRNTAEEARKELEAVKAAADERQKEAESARSEAEAAKKEAEAARKEAEAVKAALEAAQAQVAASKRAEDAARQEAVGAKRAAEEARKAGAAAVDEAGADKKSVGAMEVALKDMEVAKQRLEVRVKEVEKAMAAEKKKALKSTNENKRLVGHLQKLEKDKVSLEARLAAMASPAPTLLPASAPAPAPAPGALLDADAMGAPSHDAGATQAAPPITKETPTPVAPPQVNPPPTVTPSATEDRKGKEQPLGAEAQVVAATEVQGSAEAMAVPAADGAATQDTSPEKTTTGAAQQVIWGKDGTAGGPGEDHPAKGQGDAAPEARPSKEAAKKEAPPQASAPTGIPSQKQDADVGAAKEGDAILAAPLLPAAPAASPARSQLQRDSGPRQQLLSESSPSAPVVRRAPPVKLARKDMTAAAKVSTEEGLLPPAPPAPTASPAKRGVQAGEGPPPAVGSHKRARSEPDDAAMPEAQRKAREAAAAALSRPSASKVSAPTPTPTPLGSSLPPLGLTPASASVVSSASRPREAEAQSEGPSGKRLRVDAAPFVPLAASPQEEVRAVVAADLAEGVAGGALAGSQRERVQAVAVAEVAAAEEAEKAELIAEAQAMETEEDALGGGEVGPQELEPGDMEAQRQPYAGEGTATDGNGNGDADGGGDMEVEGEVEPEEGLEEGLEEGQIAVEETGEDKGGESAPRVDVGSEAQLGTDERGGGSPKMEAPKVTEENVSLLGQSRAPLVTADPEQEQMEAAADADAGGTIGKEAGAVAAEDAAGAMPGDSSAGPAVAEMLPGAATPQDTKPVTGPDESKAKAVKKSASKAKKGVVTKKESATQEKAEEAEEEEAVVAVSDAGAENVPPRKKKMISLVKVVNPQTPPGSGPAVPSAVAIAKTLGQAGKGPRNKGRGGGNRAPPVPSPRAGQKKGPAASPPKRNVQGKKGDKGQKANPYEHLPKDE